MLASIAFTSCQKDNVAIDDQKEQLSTMSASIPQGVNMSFQNNVLTFASLNDYEAYFNAYPDFDSLQQSVNDIKSDSRLLTYVESREANQQLSQEEKIKLGELSIIGNLVNNQGHITIGGTILLLDFPTNNIFVTSTKSYNDLNRAK